jgi:hypothetical protein
MLNIRTFILSVTLVAILMLAVPLVTARTEAFSNPAGEPVAVPDNSEASADQRKSPIASYRSQFGECFDVPIRELAGCLNASQASVQADQSPVDECFDVSISELAGCRKQSQESIP